nr:uncharacterized protein LOC117276480 [Nicotiana tomentosiformis]
MDVETIKLHLYRYGFVENYFLWKYQGKKNVTDEMSSSDDLHGGSQPESGYENPYRQMVLDAVGPNFGPGLSWKSYNNTEPESSNFYEPSMEAEPNPSMEEEPNPSMDEEPNLECQRFYDLLQAADAKLYPGSSLSQLVVVFRMLNIKMENTLSQRGYNQMIQLLKEALREDNTILDNYYETKKLVRSLGLPVKKIDCCNSGCMLYWVKMRTSHLASFVATRGRKYSSWTVIVTPYNLPPGMCIKEAYMFLTVIVQGPNNPKQKMMFIYNL